MAHAITLIPGDGTGPEITEATRRVLDTAGGSGNVGAAWYRFARSGHRVD